MFAGKKQLQSTKVMARVSNIDCEPTKSEFANRRARSVSGRHWIYRLSLSLLVIFSLVMVLVLWRAPILTGLAVAWVVNDAPVKADAIVILGGNPEIRPFEAAKLYHEGLAPKILYMDVRLGGAAKSGITLSEREITRRILLSNNIPESALVAIGHGVASTHDESLAVRAWMENSGSKSILIPTDIFHTRRVRWLFLRELRHVRAQIRVQAVQLPTYNVDDWWRHEDGLIAFESEVIKSIYYWFKY
jgi:uncharacterized SAM-binding protein YcdF (DUF218 family)